MPRHTSSQNQRFQLLTAAILVSSIWQSLIPVPVQSASTAIINQASYTYNTSDQDSGSQQVIQGTTAQVQVQSQDQNLVDPLGQITGCAGETLPDYTGFSVGLYETEPNDPTGTEIKNLVPLTQTELPDIPDNKLPRGIAPNTQNSNPFSLTNGEKGNYSFLFDANRGQLDIGRTYILLIHPPSNSIYSERRIRIVITGRNDSVVSYSATSVDGKAISASDNRTSETGTINIQDAERLGLKLNIFSFDSQVCQSQEVQIVKTGDRATAQPGDTVVYRVAVKNLSSAALNNVVLTDTLPLGFNFVPKSVRGQIGSTPVTIATTHSGRTVTFRAEGASLPSNSNNEQVLNIVYAAVLTADAARGDGENSAIVNGQRADNNQSVKDGPAIHKLRIDPGILSDCGTLIGRVFVDKNFDGEQQKGEPGVPNAVIFMDDGNRITTDPNGLFSVANVISGYRTGVLDLSSLPGYTLAPNRRFIERNSQSRLVHLEPGGLVRMNFGVTPTFAGGKAK